MSRLKELTKNRQEAYRILANNRYAEKPKHISRHQWNAIKVNMEKRYTKEWMTTPEGLYSNSEIWSQTFQHIK